MPPAPTCSTATPAAPFDPPRQYAREQAIFGAGDAVLRLALPAVLSRPRRAAGADALRAGARALAGRDARSLSLGDARHLSTATARWPTRYGFRSSLAFPAVFINLGHGHNGFLTAALFGGCAAAARSQARSRRRAVRPAWPTSRNSAARSHCARGKRTVAHLCRSGRDRRSADDHGHVRVRSRCLERVPRLDQVHARRRARAAATPAGTRSRASFPGANVGRRNFARLCRPGRGHACRRRRARLAVARPASFPLKAAALRSARSSQRLTASTTTLCCSRQPLRSLPPTGCSVVSPWQKIPAGSAMARADSGPPGCAGDTDPACGPARC